MSTREEIRKGIEELSHRYIKGYIKPMPPMDYFNLLQNLRKAILGELHKQGVVIKVERDLPENPYNEDSIKDDLWLGAEDYKDIIENAGYTLVEPLIEEG